MPERTIAFVVRACPLHSTPPNLLTPEERCHWCTALYMAWLEMQGRFENVRVEVRDGND